MLRLLIACAAVAGCRPPPAPVAPTGASDPDLLAWASRHPTAAEELGVWIRTHPEGAPQVFVWDDAHPARSMEFIDWALEHQAGDLLAFFAGHSDWPIFSSLVEGKQRPTLEALMAWCRRHPQAARELMHHPRGLYRAGTHLYASLWREAR